MEVCKTRHQDILDTNIQNIDYIKDEKVMREVRGAGKEQILERGCRMSED